MPTYVCTAAVGRLTPVQKTEIVRRITAIHHEETGAPRYLVQVIFYDVAPDSHYVAGQLAPADQIWVRADIRSGRTNEQNRKVFHAYLEQYVTALLRRFTAICKSRYARCKTRKFDDHVIGCLTRI
jgi:phenylpyruvate tautomerase PptA (4-oxalocrotonate tautomerase family)